jgi:prevent-host-death family protein
LPGLTEQHILPDVSTISVNDLQKKPAKQWLKAASQDDLVITSKGQPVAVLLRIAAASVESTRALVRSVRALQAQAALQQGAAASGVGGLTPPDIDAEIAAARRARRRK